MSRTHFHLKVEKVTSVPRKYILVKSLTLFTLNAPLCTKRTYDAYLLLLSRRLLFYPTRRPPTLPYFPSSFISIHFQSKALSFVEHPPRVPSKSLTDHNTASASYLLNHRAVQKALGIINLNIPPTPFNYIHIY